MREEIQRNRYTDMPFLRNGSASLVFLSTYRSDGTNRFLTINYSVKSKALQNYTVPSQNNIVRPIGDGMSVATKCNLLSVPSERHVCFDLNTVIVTTWRWPIDMPLATDMPFLRNGSTSLVFLPTCRSDGTDRHRLFFYQHVVPMERIDF